MKKTIHISLSGIAFKIEEDAYEQLKNYLEAVKAILGGDDEFYETIDDIESRMAELFIPVTQESQLAINIKDVEKVIEILGEPRDYAPSDNEQETTGKKDDYTQVKHKRLFRDPYSSVVGGVCGGLGAYFNVDPILFRLLFIIGLFYGISVIPYLILWIVMPKAVTIDQRIQMSGGEPFFNKGKSSGSTIIVSSDWNRVLRILGVVIGLGIILISFSLMVVMTVSLLLSGPAMNLVPEAGYLWNLHDMIFVPGDSVFFIGGLLLSCGVPLLLLFYLGLHLVFQFKKGGKMIGVLGLILWLLGIGLLMIGGMKLGFDFRYRSNVSQVVNLEEFSGDTLFLEGAKMPGVKKESSLRLNKIYLNFDEDEMTIYGEPKIILKENSAYFSIDIEKHASGANENIAKSYADATSYFWVQNDSVLELDEIFTLPVESRIRDQKVIVRVSVPKGKVVKIDNDLEAYLVRTVN